MIHLGLFYLRSHSFLKSKIKKQTKVKFQKNKGPWALLEKSIYKEI